MQSRPRKRKAKRKGPGFPRPTGFLRSVLVVVMLGMLFFLGIVAGIVATYSRNLPDISRMADYQPARSTRIFARDGTLIASVYKENRVWVPISHIPLDLQHAFIANEDHNFYTHHGVDFGGIARAAVADFTHQQFQGASTITQQLARGLFLSNEVSISRKIQEALLAIEIERYYTKDEILERYLNLIYLGAGAYGVDAAAHTYFGANADHLTLGQCAMLAGVVAAPSDYSPFANLDLARDRQRHVLDRMVESGYISSQQADDAYAAPLRLVKQRAQGLQGYLYPYYSTYVIAELEKLFGTQAVEEGGLQVDTALDPRMEQIAQDAVSWGVDQARAEGIGAHQGALVAIRPSTGEIVAMIGGDHFSLENQFNRAWQARRQPGSSFKTYLYTAAIDSGMPASTVIDDSPVGYPMGDGTTWYPKNDDNRFLGPVTLREALALSRNVVAVKLADQIGVDKLIDYAHRMGVESPLDPYLSLALGSSGVTVLDQASGYETLANQGVHIDPTALRVVRDSLGNMVLDDQYPQATDVVNAGTAYIMTTMLEDVINHGTGYPNAIIGRPAAGKTGTTSDFHDAWFVGYTPDLVTAVWIGNDNNAAMYESYGGDIPARIWARFMRAALANVPKHDFVFPADQVVKIASCSRYGNEYYLIGTQPTSGCVGHASDANAAVVAPPPPAVATAHPAPSVTLGNEDETTNVVDPVTTLAPVPDASDPAEPGSSDPAPSAEPTPPRRLHR